VDVGAFGIDFLGCVDLDQRRRIFLLVLVDLRQPEMRIGHARIAAQRLPVALLGVLVVLHQPVDFSEFVVVEGEVGFDRSVFQELVSRPREILQLQIRVSQIEVHERKFGIGGGGLKFLQGRIVLLGIQIRFSDKKMVCR
jgi:hypothetical protein